MPDSTGDRNQEATAPPQKKENKNEQPKQHIPEILITCPIHTLHMGRKNIYTVYIITYTEKLNPFDPMLTSSYHGKTYCGSNNAVSSRNGEPQE